MNSKLPRLNRGGSPAAPGHFANSRQYSCIGCRTPRGGPPRVPDSNPDSIDKKELLAKADTKCQDFVKDARICLR